MSSDRIIAPDTIVKRLYREEAERWGHWQDIQLSHDTRIGEREAQEWRLADGIVCGSQFVIDGLVSCGAPREKCHLVPYTADVSKFTPKSLAQMRRGDDTLRVLYVGGVDLRKGIQYLYEALKLLDSKRVQVKVVGGIALKPEAVAQLASMAKS